jgi:hypothetical protein
MTTHFSLPARHARWADTVRTRRALAVLVAAHGLAHLVGTGNSFSRAADGRSVDYLAGNWTISNPTTLRAFGVLWAVAAVAFVVTAVIIWAGRPEWPRVLGWVSLASLVLVLTALWASLIGVFVDLLLPTIAWHEGRRYSEAAG